MGMSPETIASDARSHDGLPRRAAGPAVPVPRVRCWVLAVLLGLVAAAVGGLIVAVAARLRSPAAAGAARRPRRCGWIARGPGYGSRSATAAVAAASDPRAARPACPRSRRRPTRPRRPGGSAAEGLDALRCVAAWTRPGRRVGRLPRRGMPARWGGSSSPGHGVPTTRAATAVMGSGRCITRPRAWPAMAWAVPGAPGPRG